MKKLNEECKETEKHSKKAIASFKEGQKIHSAYRAAPDPQNLVEEIEQFTDKLKAGLAELNLAAKSRNK